MWNATPMLPLIMIYGGFAEGTAETIGMATLIAAFAAAWAMVGQGVVRASTR